MSVTDTFPPRWKIKAQTGLALNTPVRTHTRIELVRDTYEGGPEAFPPKPQTSRRVGADTPNASSSLRVGRWQWDSQHGVPIPSPGPSQNAQYHFIDDF